MTSKPNLKLNRFKKILKMEKENNELDNKDGIGTCNWDLNGEFSVAKNRE